MAQPLETVVKQLADSGIIAPGKLENFIPPKAHPTSVEELVTELVKQSHLTKFQAQHVNAGKTKSLILGAYTIIDKIGAGGMGQVFKAQHRRMDRLVAIKMLPPAMTKNAAALARFEREVRAAAKLNHSNIVTAYDADQANGAHFLVMEYVEGKDLSALAKKNGPFPVGKAVNYVLQAAKGLEFAHKKGVIHRDIKPANLLLDGEGTVKILDMGLARIESDGGPAQAELTGTGTIMGTVDYMAPEQGMSTKHADARADIYSLGCSLYYLIAGKPAYGGETVAAKLVAHHNHPIPALQEAHPEVPQQLEAVFKKMVAKKIEDRYQTMTEVVADLEKCQSAVNTAATSNTSVWKPESPSSGESEVTAFFGNQRLKRISEDPFATDDPPKKERRASRRATRRARGASPGTAAPRNRTKLLIAAGAAGFLAVLFGVIVIIRNQQGEEVGRLALASDHTAEVLNLPASGKRELAGTSMPASTSNAAPDIGGLAPPARLIAPFNAQQARAGQNAWAKYLNTTVDQKNSVGMTLVLIPPGEFLMGSTPEQNALGRKIAEDFKSAWGHLKEEGPQHRVVLTRPFWLGSTEVTIGQFKKFVEATKYVTDGEQFGFGDSHAIKADDRVTPEMKKMTWRTPGYAVTDDLPVTQVTWNDCIVFCNWLSAQERLQPCYRQDAKSGWLSTASPGRQPGNENYGYRLPTEAEWEYACRAGTTTQFSFGDDPSMLDIYGWFSKNAGGSARAVGLKVANPFGLFDMHGNVSEWCQDLRAADFYSKSSTNDPIGPSSGTARVSRGGVWSNSPVYCRSASRNSNPPDYRYNHTGFRMVRASPSASAIGWAPPTIAGGKEVGGAQHALDFDGKASFVTTPIRYDGTHPLTVEAFATLRSSTSKGTVLADENGVSHSGFILEPRQLKWFSTTVSGQSDNFSLATISSQAAPGPGSVHLAAVFNHSEVRFYVGGELQGTKSSHLRPSNYPILIGGNPTPNGGANDSFDGLIDEARISNIARYTGNFTPTPRFTSDANTLALYHFDEGSGDVLKDASSFHHDARIVKANWVTVDSSGSAVGWAPPTIAGGKEVDGAHPTIPTKPITTLADPAFQQWMKDVAAMSAYKQVDAVAKKLQELNPGFDGNVTPQFEGRFVTSLDFMSDDVSNISPVRALPRLNALRCVGGGSGNNKLSDLAPLAGMPLKSLDCKAAKVADLSPLRGMPLHDLHCENTPVSDLSPLAGMPLTTLNCGHTKVSDLSPLNDCQALTTLNVADTKVTPAGVAALQKALPNCKIEWDGPTKTAAANVNPDRRAAEIVLRLGGTIRVAVPAANGGAVEQEVTSLDGLPKAATSVLEIDLHGRNVGYADMSSIGALKSLKKLELYRVPISDADLAHLDEFTNLTYFNIGGTKVTAATLPKLRSLHALTFLQFNITPVVAAKVLENLPADCKLSHLVLANVTDADVERIVRIATLSVVRLETETPALLSNKSVAALARLPNLDTLGLANANLTEQGLERLVELKKLTHLSLDYVECVNDRSLDRLRPLKNLKSLTLHTTALTAAGVAALQKALPNCKIEWGDPLRKAEKPKAGGAAWQSPAFQQWVKDVQALPAEKQVEAVSKKLIELNPGGRRGSHELKIDNGVVTFFNLANCQLTDISPIRALTGLKLLRLDGANSVSDLSPLQGLPLTTLTCYGNPVSDLSPLTDCKNLQHLDCRLTKVTPAAVAALRKALPNCKIEWVDPKSESGKPKTGGAAWQSPAFQAWMKDVQALPAEKQVEAVSKKLMELNPGFDGKVTPTIEKGKGVVTALRFVTDNVTDISPVRTLAGLMNLVCSGSNLGKGKASDLSSLNGMKLTILNCSYTQVSDLSALQGTQMVSVMCGGTQVSDLSPLKGMPLTYLSIAGTPVSDLSPLKGMPLTALHCDRTNVSDLSLLNGMPLTELRCSDTNVSDLSPLAGMNLTALWLTPKSITKGLDVIRQMKNFKTIGTGGANEWPPAEFWKKYDAGEFGKPVAAKKLAYLDPAFQTWVADTQKLPAEMQIEAVSKKLMELNPGFNGALTGAYGKGSPKIGNGMVTELGFSSDNVTDVSPVRALPGLKALFCSFNDSGKGKLSDLSPLKGMRLTLLDCHGTQISDLSPLQGMQLTYLDVIGTKVSDLTPVQGMHLITLRSFNTQVVDLLPLKGMPLTYLSCGNTQVSDLTPLQAMPLMFLAVQGTHVSDLSPLKDCRTLKALTVTSTKITPASVAALQKALPNCKIFWDDPKADSGKPKADGAKTPASVGAR